MPSVTNIILGKALAALAPTQPSAQTLRENNPHLVDQAKLAQLSQMAAVQVTLTPKRSEDRQVIRTPKHVDPSYGSTKSKSLNDSEQPDQVDLDQHSPADEHLAAADKPKATIDLKA